MWQEKGRNMCSILSLKPEAPWSMKSLIWLHGAVVFIGEEIVIITIFYIPTCNKKKDSMTCESKQPPTPIHVSVELST